jgi:hypothetical protein
VDPNNRDRLPPEKPVVHNQQLRPSLCGSTDACQARIHGKGHPVHPRLPFHLQAIQGSILSEVRAVQLRIQIFDKLRKQDAH